MYERAPQPPQGYPTQILSISADAVEALKIFSEYNAEPALRHETLLVELEDADEHLRECLQLIIDGWKIREESQPDFLQGAAVGYKLFNLQALAAGSEVPEIERTTSDNYFKHLDGMFTTFGSYNGRQMSVFSDTTFHHVLDSYEMRTNKSQNQEKTNAFIFGGLVVYELMYRQTEADRTIAAYTSDGGEHQGANTPEFIGGLLEQMYTYSESYRDELNAMVADYSRMTDRALFTRN